MTDQQRAGLHVSGEVLMHFRCGALDCQQWFSIADWPAAQAEWSQGFVYCPRCGRCWGLPAAAVQSALESAAY